MHFAGFQVHLACFIKRYAFFLSLTKKIDKSRVSRIPSKILKQIYTFVSIILQNTIYINFKPWNYILIVKFWIKTCFIILLSNTSLFYNNVGTKL